MNQEADPNQTASKLILDFSASRTVRNKYLFFKPPSLSIFVITTWIDKRHEPIFHSDYYHTDPGLLEPSGGIEKKEHGICWEIPWSAYYFPPRFFKLNHLVHRPIPEHCLSKCSRIENYRFLSPLFGGSESVRRETEKTISLYSSQVILMWGQV